MKRRIHIDFRKWPDQLHWQAEMEYLGEDDHGLRLWRSPGCPARRGDDLPITTNNSAVKVITPGDWWTAIWNDEQPVTVYVDIATPAVWDGDHVTMIDLDLDLDLDVVQLGDGSVEIHDEDEFLEHQISLGYPRDVVNRAIATTERLVAAVETRTEPFGGTALRSLEMARELTSRQ